MYVDIAVSCFNDAQDAYIELMSQDNEEPNSRTYELLTMIQKNCIETITFSVMALESYINTIAAAFISKKYLDSMEECPLYEKWINVIKKVTGITLTKGDTPIVGISKNAKLRNKFVHSKSKTVNVNKDGAARIPCFSVREVYIDAAYQALKNVEVASVWVKTNWPECVLMLYDNDEIQLKEDFLDVDCTWCFMERTVIF